MDDEAAVADEALDLVANGLDENGFPFDPLSPEESGGGGGVEEAEELPWKPPASSFASDFYSSGTDWSSLVGGVGVGAGKGSKGLVQRNLLQIWGIGSPVSPEPSSSTAYPPSPPRKKHRGAAAAMPPRVCPFYKKIPGSAFTVDAFGYGQIVGCSAYFLTHFHHDHYGGLRKNWSHGPIYCTPLTARLVKMCLSVNPMYIRPLEFGAEHVIDGVKVTMLEANHCPGAAMIHFCMADGRCHLHTGDFRASKKMQTYDVLVNKRVNVLFLDTTYCNPRYRFPPSEDVISFVVRTTRKFLERLPTALVVVGAYSIGKEQVYLAISQALRVQIYTDAARRRILQSFNWPELSGKLCTDGQRTQLHVLPISFLRPKSLKDYLRTYSRQFSAVLAFRPTGWTFSEKNGSVLDLIKPTTEGNITIYGVPYSEHSSFTELGEFIKFLRPEKIIPTVNVGNAATRDKMQSYFREWLRSPKPVEHA